jgi:prophage DNA circulation protein
MSRRVTDKIVFTTPSGVEHYALWSGSTHSLSKKVGQFEYPDVDGGGAQDLGIGIQKFPLDFVFTGDSYAQRAYAFEVSLLERGEWSVSHPELGLIKLQPVSFKIKDDPVRENNTKRVSSQWIRLLPEYGGSSFADSEAKVLSFGRELPATIAEKLPENPYNPDDINGFLKFLLFCAAVADAIRKAVAKFYEINNLVRQEMQAALVAFDQLLLLPATLSQTLLSALNTIIQIPATVDTIVTSKAGFYRELGNNVREVLQIEIDDNTVVASVATANDQIQSGIIGGMAISTTNGEVRSRADAVEISEAIYAEYSDSLQMMESLQDALAKKFSGDSYLGNIAGYQDFLNLVGLTVGYVIDDNYAQQVKKQVVIPEFTATLNYAMEQYKELSPEDAYDFFISTNLLAGDDIVFLPVGREVVVYV